MNGKARVAWLDGRSVGASSMSITCVCSERPHTGHDRCQPAEDSLQVIIKLRCGCDPEMSLDHLPQRAERFVSRERQVFFGDVRVTRRLQDRASGCNGSGRIGADVSIGAIKLV